MARTDPRPSKNHTPQIHAYRALLAATRGIVTPCDDGQGTEWFSDDEQQQQRAAELCQTCPAIQACAAYAITAGETTGVWGGTTPSQRKAQAQQPDQPGTPYPAPSQAGTACSAPSHRRRAQQLRPPSRPATVDQQPPDQPGALPRWTAARHHDTTAAAGPGQHTITRSPPRSEPGRNTPATTRAHGHQKPGPPAGDLTAYQPLPPPGPRPARVTPPSKPSGPGKGVQITDDSAQAARPGPCP